MSEESAYYIFWIICAIIFMLQQLGYWHERLGADREQVAGNQSRVNEILQTGDLEQIRTELALVVAETIREPLERIELDVDFQRHLRVPPGEMEVLFDEVDQSFQVELNRSKIRTFKDLLQQICDQRSS